MLHLLPVAAGVGPPWPARGGTAGACAQRCPPPPPLASFAALPPLNPPPLMNRIRFPATTTPHFLCTPAIRRSAVSCIPVSPLAPLALSPLEVPPMRPRAPCARAHLPTLPSICPFYATWVWFDACKAGGCPVPFPPSLPPVLVCARPPAHRPPVASQPATPRCPSLPHTCPFPSCVQGLVCCLIREWEREGFQPCVNLSLCNSC